MAQSTLNALSALAPEDRLALRRLGTPVPIGAAASQVAGFCLLDDRPERDCQAWK